MKVELKKIKMSSVVFSVYPIIIAVMGVIYSIFTIMWSNANTAYITPLSLKVVLLTTLAYVVIVLLASMLFVLLYNVLCATGIKGITLELEDKE